MKIIVLAFFLFILIITSVVFAQFNLSDYTKMPPLYNFDDYDSCLISKSTYCMVYVEIVPNPRSNLWNQIAHVSGKHKQHYRHDLLFYGVCMEKCKNLYNSLKEADVLKYKTDVIENNELVALYAKIHAEHQRQNYNNHFIDVCLNQHFQIKYNITVRTSVEYCVDQQNEQLKHDAFDVWAYVIFTTIVILNVLSTLYDIWLHTLSSKNNCFFHKTLSNPKHLLLTSFSICRNYYRIVGKWDTVLVEGRQMRNKQLESDLCFIDAYRVIAVFFVILAHTILLYMASPIQNPQFFEQSFYRPETAIFQNGAVIIQIFFIISGFLLYTKFEFRKLVTVDMSIRNCFKMYFQIFLFRYLRILPSLMILMLFNATILIRLQNGPFWWHICDAERTFCRSFYWKNILLINNYLMEDSCAHQTWYLATDMQLFEFFLILLILVTKFPKLRKFLFWCILISAIGIPAFITYIYKLDAVYHSSPESYRYFYFKDAETFYKAYIPFYANLAGYLFGITSAYIFMHSSCSVKDHFKNHLVYKIGWWVIFPIAFSLLFLADYITALNFPILSALFAGLYRTIWCLIGSIALLGMCFKLGWIALDFTRMKIFHLLSRISYQSFLWHVVVLRIMSGYIRQPVYINRFFLISQVLVTFVMTQIVAFICALFFEYPLAELIKYISNKFNSSQSVTKTTNDAETIDMQSSK